MSKMLEEFHTFKRKQGWRCKLGASHDGPCPLVPLWWRRPIWWLKWKGMQ